MAQGQAALALKLRKRKGGRPQKEREPGVGWKDR